MPVHEVQPHIIISGPDELEKKYNGKYHVV